MLYYKCFSKISLMLCCKSEEYHNGDYFSCITPTPCVKCGGVYK